MNQLIQKNLKQMNLTGNEVLTYEEANEVVNNNIITTFSKKPVTLKEVKSYTALELAEKMALIQQSMFEYLKVELLGEADKTFGITH